MPRNFISISVFFFMYNFKLSYKSRVFLTIIIKHGKTRDFSNSKISRTSIKASFLARILFKKNSLSFARRDVSHK